MPNTFGGTGIIVSVQFRTDGTYSVRNACRQRLGLPTVQIFSGLPGISWCCAEKGGWPFWTVRCDKVEQKSSRGDIEVAGLWEPYVRERSLHLMRSFIFSNIKICISWKSFHSLRSLHTHRACMVLIKRNGHLVKNFPTVAWTSVISISTLGYSSSLFFSLSVFVYPKLLLLRLCWLPLPAPRLESFRTLTNSH